MRKVTLLLLPYDWSDVHKVRMRAQRQGGQRGGAGRAPKGGAARKRGGRARARSQRAAPAISPRPAGCRATPARRRGAWRLRGAGAAGVGARGGGGGRRGAARARGAPGGVRARPRGRLACLRALLSRRVGPPRRPSCAQQSLFWRPHAWPGSYLLGACLARQLKSPAQRGARHEQNTTQQRRAGDVVSCMCFEGDRSECGAIF